jgi:transcriptional regulator of acetoin/glycerol metabolism
VLRTALAMLEDEDVIELRHLPDDFLEDIEAQQSVAPTVEAASESPASSGAGAVSAAPSVPAAPTAALESPVATLREQELQSMRQALRQCGGNVSAAARALGVSRNTIYRRLGRTTTEI